VKKYLNAEAFKMYEKFIVGGTVYPQWFRNFDLNDARTKETFESGYIFPLKERDQDGRRVIMVRAGVFNTKKFTADDLYHIIMLVVFTVLEEPETQVSGIVFLTDFKDTTLDYISMFNIAELKAVVQFLQNGVPCRIKKAVWINFPSFGVALADMAKAFLTPKLAQRIHFYNDGKMFAETVDVKILPKEYGGVTPISEMIASFKTFFESQKGKLKKSDEQVVDVDRVVDYKLEPVDSFKKLDID
jgi:CRAL/TRIO domain